MEEKAARLMDDYEDGDTVYMPDGTQGWVHQLSRSGGDVNGVQVEFRGVDGLDRHWFDPEDLHRMSVHARLRRIEERLGIDD